MPSAMLALLKSRCIIPLPRRVPSWSFPLAASIVVIRAKYLVDWGAPSGASCSLALSSIGPACARRGRFATIIDFERSDSMAESPNSPTRVSVSLHMGASASNAANLVGEGGHAALGADANAASSGAPVSSSPTSPAAAPASPFPAHKLGFSGSSPSRRPW